MAYNTRDYIFLSSLSIFQYLENTTFRKQDLFPSSGEGVGETYLLGPLEIADLNHVISRDWGQLFLTDLTE
jgi:hypothetical protein